MDRGKIVSKLMQRLKQDQSERSDRSKSVCSYIDLPTPVKENGSGRLSTPKITKQVDITLDLMYPWQIENRDPLYRPPVFNSHKAAPIKRRFGQMTDEAWMNSLRSQPPPSQPIDVLALGERLNRYHGYDWGAFIRMNNRDK